MAEPRPDKIKDASYPFDQAHADIILRSSDSVDFRVHKTILWVASSVFRDMLCLPQPSQSKDDECRDGLPVVMLEEDAKTLNFILRTIYPVRSPTIGGLDDLYPVFHTVQKYCFEAFEGFVEEQLNAALQREPISVYAIACQYEFDDIAQRAAEASLALPSVTHSQYLKQISGEQYSRLIQYHRDCVNAVDKVLSSDEWFATCPDIFFDGSPAAPCSTCFTQDSTNSLRSSKPWQAPPQLWTYLTRAGVALKERPGGVIDDLIEVPPILHCQHSSVSMVHDDSEPDECRLWDTRNGMSRFRSLLKQGVRKAIATVTSPKVQKSSSPVAVPKVSKSGHASSPFDEDDADVILRSSDHVDFRVHKIILSLASPVFKEMFNTPQPSHLPDTDEPQNSLRVIALEEDADTLDFILRKIYPVPSPIVAQMDDLRFVIGPSQKYRFKAFNGFVEESLKKAMLWEPHSVYAIACQYGFPEVAAEAARTSLSLPLTTPSRYLDRISGEQYFRLLSYHQNCAAAATKVATSQEWLQVIPGCMLHDHTSCSVCFVPGPSGGRWRAPEYAWVWLTRIGQALERRPTTECIHTDKGDDFKKVIDCKHLTSSSGKKILYRDTTRCIPRLQQLLSEAVDKAIALLPQVPSPVIAD